MSLATISTYTGKTVDLLEPDPDTICIEDIAHALSLICRFTGHTRKHYSVGQHSVLVAQHCGSAFQFEGLMHDASEAYLNDVARPLKRCLAEYKAIEERFERMLAIKFDLPFPLPAEVKHVDMRMLVTERRDLMRGPKWKESDIAKLEPYPETITCWKPRKSEREFLDAFDSVWCAR